MTYTPTDIPPYSSEAEEAVLYLLCGGRVPMVKRLTPDHFYRDINRIIFQACLDAQVHHGTVDNVLVLYELRKRFEGRPNWRQEFQRFGDYVVYLVREAYCPPVNLQYYLNILDELRESRGLIEKGVALVQAGYKRGKLKQHSRVEL